MSSENPISWLEKRSDVRGKSVAIDGTMSSIDLLFQKGGVKQIHPKGIDVDSRGPSEYSGSRARSRSWSHGSLKRQIPIVTRSAYLWTRTRGKGSHT
jgi:hypothetical protein